MRTDVIRSEVQRLLRQVPFRPFMLAMESGDRIPVEHPENIAFEPSTDAPNSGSPEFYVIGANLRVFSTFEAVTNVTLIDRGE